MTAALFPGQGSERKGMLSLLKPDFQEYIREDDCPPELRTQLSIYSVSASLWDDSKKNYAFNIMAGHSLGFYSALFAAGSIDFETGIYLINSAYSAIAEVSGSRNFGMTAIIGIQCAIIENLCKKYKELYVANINSATNVVVSGALDSIELFEKIISDKALKILRLPVRYPLHTPILAEASDIMWEKTRKTELRRPEIPILAHTTNEILRSPEEIRETLIGQFSRKVIWKDVIHRMWMYGVRRFVEVGPGDVLSKLTRWIERNAKVISLDAQVSWKDSTCRRHKGDRKGNSTLVV